MTEHVTTSTVGTGSIVNAPVWMSIDDFINYHPSHPSRGTVYQWIYKKKIKVHKAAGSSLVLFLRSEIDEFLMGVEGPHK